MAESSMGETIRRFYDEVLGGNFDVLDEILHPEITWHFPGTNRLSGTYHGFDQVLAFFGQLVELPGDTRIELLDVAEGDGRAISYNRLLSTDSDGESQLTTYCIVWEFRDGQVIEAREHIFDLPALERAAGLI